MLENVKATGCNFPLSLGCVMGYGLCQGHNHWHPSEVQLACGDRSRLRLGLRRSVALLYWMHYPELRTRWKVQPFVWACAKVVSPSSGLNRRVTDSWPCWWSAGVLPLVRHLCYCCYLVRIRFHSLIWNNSAHEFEFLELELKFCCIELDVVLVTAFHQTNESSVVVVLSFFIVVYFSIY